MKIALCLYGHSRTTDTRGLKIDWVDAMPFFKKNLLDLHDVDVFIHTWGDPEDDELKNDLVRDFDPSMVKIEKSIFPNYNVDELDLNISFYQANYDGPTRIQAALSRWDSQNKSNNLRIKFQEKSKVSYDFIISCRFDLLFYSPFPFDKMNPTDYYVSNWHTFWSRQDRFYGYQDCWFVSGEENTNVYCSLYDNLMDYWKNDSELVSYCVNFLKQDPSVKFSSHVLCRWHMLNNGLISKERFYGVEYDSWSLIRKKEIKTNPHWKVPWGAEKIFNPEKTITEFLNK